MGRFNRLFGRGGGDPPVPSHLTLPGPGDFVVEVVGVSNYQDAIERAAGGRSENGCEKVVDAVLILEDSNPHDRNAVQVMIGGCVCGYLSRRNARMYRQQLRDAGYSTITARCRAKIVGGWDRGPNDRGHFGIRLDLPVR
jgi:hypothetical protein